MVTKSNDTFTSARRDSGLLPRERLFADAVLGGCSYAEAARRAGYSASRAKQAAQELLCRPRVTHYLARFVVMTDVNPLWWGTRLRALIDDPKTPVQSKVRCLELAMEYLDRTAARSGNPGEQLLAQMRAAGGGQA